LIGAAGQSASDLHFQAYLLDALTHWNQDCGVAAVQGTPSGAGTYNATLRHWVNKVGEKVTGEQLDPDIRLPGKYTGQTFWQKIMLFFVLSFLLH